MVELRVQDSTSATRLIPSPVKVMCSKKPPLKGGFFVPVFQRSMRFGAFCDLAQAGLSGLRWRLCKLFLFPQHGLNFEASVESWVGPVHIIEDGIH